MAVPWWIWALGALCTSVGVAYAMTKAWATHDWKTCQCVDCRKRRYENMKKRGYSVGGVKPNGDLIWTAAPQGESAYKLSSHYLSTAQLEQGMVVVLRGENYRVLEIQSDSKGYLVQIQPTGGKNRRREIIVTVKWENGNRRFWELRDTSHAAFRRQFGGN